MCMLLLQGQAENDDLRLPEGLSLPLQNEAEVEAFERALRDGADLRKTLVSFSRFMHEFMVCLSTLFQ